LANYRHATLLEAESIATPATKTIDLDLTDPISQIGIIVKATNNGNTPTAHPAAIISKVEIVDGSDVLFSLSGHEAQALDFFHNGRPAVEVMNWQDNVDIELFLRLNFGRRLWDPLLALDPTKFTNPQLKITHNKASGGSAPDAGTLKVMAHLFDEKKVSPLGFLAAKEWYSYVMTASAYEYVDLPDDLAIRLLMVRSLYAGQEIQALFQAVKLAYNQDKKVIFDDTTLELLKAYDVWGPYVETHEGIVGTGEISFYITPTVNTHVVSGGFGGNRDYYAGYAPWGGKVGIYAGAASTYFQSVFSGFCPHGCLGIPLGDLELIDDWWLPPPRSGPRLRVYGYPFSGITPTAQVILQQLRKY